MMKFSYTALIGTLVLTACDGHLPSDSRVKEGSPESAFVQQETLEVSGDEPSNSTGTAGSAGLAQDEPGGDMRLVDLNATEETVAVFAHLKTPAAEQTLFGMQSATTRGLTCSAMTSTAPN